MRKLIFLPLLLLISLIFFAQNGTESVKVTDMLKIKSIGSVSVNKDGSKAVFSVTAIEPDGESKTEYKYVTQVWLVHTDGSSAPIQLTTAKESSSQPVFSPDGKQVAFVRQVEGKPQLFLLSLGGGEAIQLTKSKYGAGNPRWSPDGKQLLYSVSVSMKELLNDSVLNSNKEIPKWPAERPGLDNDRHLKPSTAKGDPDGSIDEVRAYLENNANEKKAKVLYKLNFLDEADINTEISFNHFFITDARPDAKPVAVT